MAQQIPQLFGIVPTSQPCLTLPASAPTSTSYLYAIPINPTSPSSQTTKPYTHITVFLLPGITLPPNTAAAVYISLPSTQSPNLSNPAQGQTQPEFKFLGGIGPGKESAVFKISGLNGGRGVGGLSAGGMGGGGEVDMDADISTTNFAPSGAPTTEVTLGISLESAESVSSQMSLLSSQPTNPTSSPSSNNPSLVLSPRSLPPGQQTQQQQQQQQQPDTLKLAQRIIKNAFNFLASFSGNVNGGVEVVPLKAFEEWWRKFEGRVRSDPGFLERDD